MGDLKQKTVSGIIWAALQKFGTMGLAFVSNIILARLLTPADYGSIGLLTIFLVISEVFINGGFATALIQKKSPTEDDFSTVFYWNIIIAILLYGVLYLCAPAISEFYNIPALIQLLRDLGLVLILNALGAIQLSILRKNMQFKKLSIIQFTSVGVSVTAAIILAYSGWGIWTLVAQQLINAAMNTILLWVTNRWIPKLRFSFVSFKELFSYGSFLLLSDLLNNICDNIQALIIGRRYTSSDMGYYTQARKLEMVPTQSISYVVNLVTFPVYSELQDSKEKLFMAVRKSLRCMNFVNFPLMILLIVVAEPLIVLLFSDKWLPSVPYFRILCLIGLVNCLQSVNYQVVCAVGRSKEIFKWNIVKRIVGIGMILTGMNWGIEGIMYGMVCSMYFTYVVNALVAKPTTGYTIQMQIKDALPLLLICCISALASHYAGLFLHCGNFLMILIQFFIFVTIYILLSALFKREELTEYKGIIKNMIYAHR